MLIARALESVQSRGMKEGLGQRPALPERELLIFWF